MKRALLALLLAACNPATIIVPGDTGASSDAARDDAHADVDAAVEPMGGSECDQQDDCGACFMCVQGPHQACVDEAVNCSASAECTALVGCMNGCGPTDEACARACGAAHPSATSMLVAFYRCAYCDACPADCRADHDWCEAPPF